LAKQKAELKNEDFIILKEGKSLSIVK
jgi:hypothetical protein